MPLALSEGRNQVVQLSCLLRKVLYRPPRILADVVHIAGSFVYPF